MFSDPLARFNPFTLRTNPVDVTYNFNHQQTSCHGFVGKSFFETAIKLHNSQIANEGLPEKKLTKLRARLHHFQQHLESPACTLLSHNHHELLEQLEKNEENELFERPAEILNKIKDGVVNIFEQITHKKPSEEQSLPKHNVEVYDAKTKTKSGPIKGALAGTDADIAGIKDPTLQAACQKGKEAKEFFDLFGLEMGPAFHNGKEGPIIAVGHYGKNYDNAFYDGKSMAYGDGLIFFPLATTEHVGEHEQTHGATEILAGTKWLGGSGQATGLYYKGQSGGINEALSDIFAYIMYLYKNKIVDPNEVEESIRWHLAPGIFKKDAKACLRNLMYPGTAYNNKYAGEDPQKGYDDLRNWIDEANKTDPHLASAVGNKAGALLMLSFYEITGFASWKTLAPLLMTTIPRCSPEITYPQFAQIMIDVIRNKQNLSDDEKSSLKAFTGKEDQVENAIRTAFAAVGVTPSAA